MKETQINANACCKNCIWHKKEHWYDEECVEIDYCEKNECKIEDVEATCWRFASKIPVRKITQEMIDKGEAILVK